MSLDLSGYGSSPPHLSALKCVNDATFPDFGDPIKATDFGYQNSSGKTVAQLDQGTLAEAVAWEAWKAMVGYRGVSC